MPNRFALYEGDRLVRNDFDSMDAAREYANGKDSERGMRAAWTVVVTDEEMGQREGNEPAWFIKVVADG